MALHKGDGWAVANLDDLGEGPGFRKVRRELDVSEMGVNAIVLPVGMETGFRFHDEQEEVYFVHRGRLEIEFGDGSTHELDEGGLARVAPHVPRKLKVLGDQEAVYVIFGAKGGYVGRDGRVPDGEERVRATAAVLGSALLAATALAGCPVFPADSQWNQRVDSLPLNPRSAAIVGHVGRGAHAHADFGSGLYQGRPIGIPFKVVGRHQRRVPVSFRYAGESDRGRYPIPADVPIEGGRDSDGDRHVIVVDRSRCRLYELFDAHPVAGGQSWRAGSGARWNLRSNRLRPRGWTSADAAGLPILPGLVRYDEVRRGHIDHALRITVPRTRRAYVYPARHFASDLTDPDLPAMGQRVRLRHSFDTSRFPRQARVVLRALKRYGALVADNGSAWYVSGAPSRGWRNDDLATLGRVTGDDFQVVDTSRLKRPRR